MENDRLNMPETDSEKKVKVDFYLPPTILEEARLMAEGEGLNQREFYRMVFILGLNAYAEQSNKRHINKRLRSQSGSAAIAEFLKSEEGRQLIADLQKPQ